MKRIKFSPTLGHLTNFLRIFTNFFNFGKFLKFANFFCWGNEFSIYDFKSVVEGLRWDWPGSMSPDWWAGPPDCSDWTAMAPPSSPQISKPNPAPSLLRSVTDRLVSCTHTRTADLIADLRSIVMSMSVCVSVCLSARISSPEPLARSLPNFCA